MFKIIAIIVVMVVINAFMVYAILNAGKRVNEKVNKYFLNNISEIIPQPKVQVKEVEPKVETKIVYEQIPVFKVDTEKEAAVYKNTNFRENYKNIKEKMTFNTEDVIKDVMDSNRKGTDSVARTAIELSKQFDVDLVFNLSTLSAVEQEDILRSSFTDAQKSFIDEYKKTSNVPFNVVGFYEYIKRIAKSEDPTFYVKTGWKEDYYDGLGSNVVTVHDDSITEGVKIVHKDKVYDYSI